MPGPKYVKDFEFPSSFGFSGSAANGSQTVRGYERRKPQRFAQGGKVARKPAGPLSMGKATQALRRVTGSQITEREAKLLKERVSTPETLRGGIRTRREKELGLQRGGPIVRGHTRRSMPHKSSYESTVHSHMRKGGKAERGETAKHERGESPAIERREHRMSEAKAHRKGYARGGSTMKQIAHEEVVKHVNRPAPKGHRGLKA